MVNETMTCPYGTRTNAEQWLCDGMGENGDDAVATKMYDILRDEDKIEYHNNLLRVVDLTDDEFYEYWSRAQQSMDEAREWQGKPLGECPLCVYKYDIMNTDGSYSQDDSWEHVVKRAIMLHVEAAHDKTDGGKILSYLAENALFDYIDKLEDEDGTMSQIWPVWADREHSGVVGLMGESQSDIIDNPNDDFEYDERENEYYLVEKKSEQIRVTPSLLKALKQIKLDEDQKSLNDAIRFLVEFYNDSD